MDARASETTQAVEKKKYLGLQVGRAVAALMVVIFHAPLMMNHFPKDAIWRAPFIGTYGHFGVQLFFVISGFIIYHVVADYTFRPGSFLIKRFFRLWPAYFAAVILFIAVSLVTRNVTASAAKMTMDRVLQTLAFWPMQGYPVLPPGWSLEHEVIYYLFATILVGLFSLTAFFWFMIANVAVGIWLYLAHPYFWDHHLFSILNGYFLIGAALRRYLPYLRRLGFVWPASAGLILFVGGAYGLAYTGLLSNKLAQLIVIGIASGLILLALINVDDDRHPLSVAVRESRPFWVMVHVGDWSYSLYILHFTLIPIFGYVHRDVIKWPLWTPPFLLLAFVLIAIALSALAYFSIERPVTKFGGKVAHWWDKRSKPAQTETW